jgi:predicted nucleotidyltransferase
MTFVTSVTPSPARDLVSALVQVLQNQNGLEFAVLVGSRANGMAGAGSDWDIALQWNPQLEWLQMLGQTEILRSQVASALQVDAADIDLIDLSRANLAMRAQVAEEGLPLVGEDTLSWSRFLRRTWRELEDFYWDKHHAA